MGYNRAISNFDNSLTKEQRALYCPVDFSSESLDINTHKHILMIRGE